MMGYLLLEHSETELRCGQHVLLIFAYRLVDAMRQDAGNQIDLASGAGVSSTRQASTVVMAVP